MDALFHSREEIESAVVRLHSAPTNNRRALLASGIQPMSPQVTKGYQSRLWVRSIDSGYISSLSSGRKLVTHRALLEETKTRR